MTLTPQERAAVERAKEWRLDRSPECAEANERVATAMRGVGSSPVSDGILAGYALGHLSGFRAGVAAALEIVNRHYERGTLGSYTLDRIRSLLTQEPQ